jgi:predicted PurR-regulated permease PerM
MPPHLSSLRTPIVLATSALSIWLLSWMQPVLVPVALAILLTFILSPLITQMQRWGTPRIPAVIMVVVLTFAMIGSIGWLVARQVTALVDSFPRYEQNLRAKIESLRADQGGFVDRIQRIAEGITRDLEKPESGKGNTRFGPEPIPVTVVSESSPFQLSGLWSAFGPVLQPLSIVGFSIVLLIFMLIRREDLRDRVLSLVGHGRLTLTTKALDEAAERISRYLLMQLIVNGSYGTAVGAGLYLIGVPYAALWGFFAAVLRYIPYLGPWLAALFPLALSVLVSESWSPPLMVLGLFLVLELISNMLIEPWLYGRGVGVSETATLVMIAFWTWLWGPIGLLLATPLTVCLAVVGKHVPALGFLDVLLGDRPALSPATGYYQRLIARDEDEASDIAEAYADRHTLVETFDSLLIPALTSAKREAVSATLSAEEQRRLVDVTRQITEELVSNGKADDGSTQAAPVREADASSALRVRVLAIPARDESDQAALAMLAAALHDRGLGDDRIELHLSAATALVSEVLDRVDALAPAIACIAALPPGGGAQAKLLCLRLQSRFPDMKIVVGRWGWEGESDRIRSQLLEAGATEFATTIAETCGQLASLRSQGIGAAADGSERAAAAS